MPENSVYNAYSSQLNSVPSTLHCNTEFTVSVMLPCYNVEEYIGDAIKSVLSQTLKDIELIIVDNKSTDGTLDVISQFDDDRIVLIRREENSGSPYISIEQAADIARGYFAIFMCGDDFLEEDYLKILVGKAQDLQLDMCCGQMVFTDEGGRVSGSGIPNDNFDFGRTFSGKDACRMTIPHWKIGMNGALIKTEIWKRALKKYHKPGKREMYNDETLSRVLLLESSKVGIYSAKYYFRANPESSTRKFALRNFGFRTSNEDLRRIIREAFGENSKEALDMELYDYNAWIGMTLAFLSSEIKDAEYLEEGINQIKLWHDNIDFNSAEKAGLKIRKCTKIIMKSAGMTVLYLIIRKRRFHVIWLMMLIALKKAKKFMTGKLNHA